MSLQVRAATIADVDALMAFNRAMAWETERKQLNESIVRRGVERQLLEPSLGRYFIADRNHMAVGTLALTTEWSDWRNGLFWWIQSVYVLPDHRRAGVYSALHRHVVDLAKSTPGVIGIRLYVERDNVNAQQTYLALGMVETHYRLFEEEF